MSHVRQQVRDQVAALIVAASTAAGSRVYTSRAYPIETLPAITVSTPSSAIEDGLGSADALGMGVEVEVAIYARATSDVADTLDTIEAACTAALMADRELGIGAHDIEWTSHATEIDAESEAPTGRQRVTYTVWVRVARTDHETLV